MTDQPQRTINVVDLFAGCGGFTQGFHEFAPVEGGTSPFRTVGAVEWDKAAAATYAANFADEAGGADHIWNKDIAEFEPSSLNAPVDVILGGPPCQGFSGLGKGDANDPRNRLWQEYARVVNELKPKVFVIENVDRFLRSGEFDALQSATEEPDGMLADYCLAPVRVLNAADFGVPQARRRVIVLATRRDVMARHPRQARLGYPAATHRRVDPNEASTLLDVPSELLPWVAVDTVFREQKRPPTSTELPAKEGIILGHRLPGPFRTSDLHIGRNPTKLSLKRYAAIPEGGNRHDLPKELSTDNWIKHRSGSSDVMGRMHRNRPSVTIRTEFYKPEKGRYLHPTQHRPITHYEAARIQGFPTDFLWYGSKVAIGQQIGNAVPVGLAKAIAGSVHQYLQEVEQVADKSNDAHQDAELQVMQPSVR